MTDRRLSWRSRKLAVCAAVGVLLALGAGAALGAAGASTAGSKVIASATLGPAPLGIDVAPWDPLYSTSKALSSVQSLLKAAGIDELHYGGGSTADEYDWQTNRDISKCYPDTALSEFTAACSESDALDFSLFSRHARSLGAQSMVTVNYGTGTVAMAAAWAKRSLSSGQAVSQWEIGNESYGCWEDNNWLAGPPENYAGYIPDYNNTCPMDVQGTATGIATMASSYAYNAGLYMQAMLQADPSAQFGFPWAFGGAVGGASVAGSGSWDGIILKADAQYIDFVDAHYYPLSFKGDAGVGGNPSVQTVIRTVEQIPGQYASIQATLNADDPKATVVVGENGTSYLATNIPCIPGGALFAAGDVLSWLAAGAKTVDWWPLDTNANLGNSCAHPDEGMFTATGKPLTTYTGYLLASALARPGARLSELTTSDQADVLAFQSVLRDGQVAVALINTNTADARTVTVGTALAGTLSRRSYSAGNQNASNTKIVDGTTTARAFDGGVTLPRESILVFTSRRPSGMTLSTSTGGTATAGTRITIKGTLTLGGAPAPAGVPVTIRRKAARSGSVAATQTVRTRADGTFSATSLPPATGTWDYLASYTGSGYAAASRSVTVKVTAARPSLRLAVSATPVKAGTKITVTATLGAPHVNKTLTISALPAGGTRTVIKHATVNSRGRLTVSYTVKVSTAFTVTFAGDSWYTPASATATAAT